jgi:hypothetical protein
MVPVTVDLISELLMNRLTPKVGKTPLNHLSHWFLYAGEQAMLNLPKSFFASTQISVPKTPSSPIKQ